MNLSELKSLLAEHSQRHFRLALPDGSAVPVSFHITEVGFVQKTFIDCGGKLRERSNCLLQVWVGEDYDHRIETGKMAGILEKAQSIFPDEGVPVEIEFILEKVTNIPMGTEIDAINEFGGALDVAPAEKDLAPAK